MIKKHTKAYITIIIFIFLFSSVSVGQSYSRRINAWFNNIKITIDGRILETNKEPFIYEDTLYVPIDEISDALLFNASYSEENKTLKIDTNGLNDANLAQYWGVLLHQRGVKIDELNKEIDRLEKRLEDRERELNQYRFGYRDYQYPYYGYPYYDHYYYPIYSLSEMQSHLRTYYNSFNDFPNTIYLNSLGNNNYRLYIVIHNNNRSLTSISSSSVENWIRSMQQAIRSSYDSNARIEGYILDYNYYSGNRNFVEYETINNQLVFYYR